MDSKLPLQSEVAFCLNRRRDRNFGAGLTPNKRRRSFADFSIRLGLEFRFQWCHSRLDCRISRRTTPKMRFWPWRRRRAAGGASEDGECDDGVEGVELGNGCELDLPSLFGLAARDARSCNCTEGKIVAGAVLEALGEMPIDPWVALG